MQGWIFWSDWGSTPYIAMAALDGSHMEKIVYNREDGKEYLGWPNGLSLDTSSTGDRLYWIDAKLDSIFTCLVKNCMQNIEVILHNTEDIKHPFSITVFEVKSNPLLVVVTDHIKSLCSNLYWSIVAKYEPLIPN